ncbi:Tad2p [Sugiyamaella lignohabitans]|uniref:Tad2p n=1 Tax=Sugiyamaella lignohabitans TaxID=796027 RepID=A0A167D456_9ASCO|nr:Tad2p [Sugiyamaella lignohabitans]ANB12455.1 Tad2p [Sugiyamaella lignohabitans]
MLLRRFYIQENEKAPVPKTKKSRELKTEFMPLDYSKYIASEEEFIELYGEDQLFIYRASLSASQDSAIAQPDEDDDSELSEEYDLHPKKRKMSIEVKGIELPETYAVKI